MNKPKWEDAPDWAQYLAMDVDGDWYWYEFIPEWDGSSWEYSGSVMLAGQSGISAWKTLEPRP